MATVTEAATADFQQKVITQSHTVPVVVDFWAPWCGPCQVLGPVIESLAQQAQGRWELVKVNVDHNQDLSAQYQVRGIPAVKMFSGGKVVAEFSGALPEHQIQQWLEQHLPNPARTMLETLRTQLYTLQHAEATKALQQFAAEHSDMPEAQLWAGWGEVFQAPAQARQRVAHSPLTGFDRDLVEDLRTLARLMENTDAEPETTAKLIGQAQRVLKEHDFDRALKLLINVVMVNKTFADELPRKACIALFHFLGNAHPLTKKYRRDFDMALY